MVVVSMLGIGLAITLALPLSVKPTRDALGEIIYGIKEGDELILESLKSAE